MDESLLRWGGGSEPYPCTAEPAGEGTGTQGAPAAQRATISWLHRDTA